MDIVMDVTPSAATTTIKLLPETDTSPVDDPIDVFSQDEPEPGREIRVKYFFENGSTFVRAFDVENLNQWFERQPALARDPIITSVIYNNQERAVIAALAAKSYCRRCGLNPSTDGAIFVAIRLMPDEPLLELLNSLKPAFWSHGALWALLEETIQRRRSVALALLYDVGVSLFHFNLNTLATLVLLAMERGWPTRELLRLMYKRTPDRHTHRKLGAPWSHAIVLVLSAAIHTLRHKDVTRIMKRLVHYADPLHIKAMRAQLKSIIMADTMLQIVFHHYDLRVAGIMNN